MPLHVLFTEDGIPGWIGDKPRDGSEEITLPDSVTDPIAFLAANRRNANGKWVKRAKSPAPTAEERARERAEQRESRRETNRLAIRAAIAEEMPELLAALALGEITQAELRDARQAIRDRFRDDEA